MQFMTIVKSVETPFDQVPPALFEAIAKLGEEATKAGVFVTTGGLMPSAQGSHVRLSGGRIKVTDGPFAEAKEVIGGFAVYQTKTKEEAVEWAVRFLDVHKRHWPGWEGEVEVRELMNFGPAT